MYRGLELLFVKQSTLCWAILVIERFWCFPAVATRRSPHQPPTSHLGHSSASLCHSSQHEEEAPHAQSDRSFNRNGAGTAGWELRSALLWSLTQTQTPEFSATSTLSSLLLLFFKLVWLRSSFLPFYQLSVWRSLCRSGQISFSLCWGFCVLGFIQLLEFWLSVI